MTARRSLPRLIPAAFAGFTALALAASAAAAQDARPTVAVLYFDNNSIGRDAADFAGIGKGIADLLITDLAANPELRVVERERIQTLLREQDLVRQGAIDPETAIRLGKLLGVRHMVTGGFMSTGSQMVLTARTIDVETGRIDNPQRVQQAGDDVLALIGQLSSRLTTTLKLPAVERRTGDAGHGAGHPKDPADGADTAHMHDAAHHTAMRDTAHMHDAAHHTAMRDTAHAHDPAHHAAMRDATAPRPAPAATKSSKPSRPTKLDLRTALLYSKALEAQDAGDRGRAVQLYDQVLSRYPDLESARTNRDKLASSDE